MSRILNRFPVRAPAALPLVEDDWNRLSLRIEGDVVRLSLNGHLVYERPLEPTNLRSFGLFHYADQTEAQTRRITWRGGWPPEVPSLADQELTDPISKLSLQVASHRLDDKRPEKPYNVTFALECDCGETFAFTVEQPGDDWERTFWQLHPSNDSKA